MGWRRSPPRLPAGTCAGITGGAESEGHASAGIVKTCTQEHHGEGWRVKGMFRLARRNTHYLPIICNLKLLQKFERKGLPLSLVSSDLPSQPGLMQIKS